ncbi:MAG: c-type cytochrome domain-containing protein, partial [Verrucomicrobiota bacterium]
MRWFPVRIRLKNHTLLLSGLLSAFLSTLALQEAAGDPSFSREVLPILSDRCFHCHGPDEHSRKADLRLDDETEAKKSRDGLHVIRPGNVEGSALWKRITSTNPDDQMPPPDSHRKPLTETEQATIRQW